MAQAIPAPYNQPPPAPPLPCGNMAQGTSAQDTSGKVKAGGSAAMTEKSTSSPSSDLGPMGVGGVISGQLMGKLEFQTCQTSKVKIEGKKAARMGDQTKHNAANAQVGAWAAPSQTAVKVVG